MSVVSRAAYSRLALLLLCLPLAGFGPFGDKKSVEQERQEILDMRDQVLERLYQQAPGARTRIERAAGYAVFSSIGVNVLLLSTAHGEGVAHDNATGEDLFMKMLSAGAGIGAGVKDYRLVFVFATKDAMDRFVMQGWQAGGQADAAAKTGDTGDEINYAIDVAPDIKLYQLTENGLALQATIQGTKYYLDDDLNG